MMAPRTARAQQTRNSDTRAAGTRRMPGMAYRGKLAWDAQKIPADKVYRWVAESIQGVPDPENVASRLTNGWTYVPADRHPEIPLLDPTSNVIKRGGQVLMERDRSIHEEDLEMIRRENEDILRSTQWTGMDGDPTMPRVDHSETAIQTTRGVGPVDKGDDFLRE